MELLAPGGDMDSIKAGIVAGADAIYCGLNKFNARNRAPNLAWKELNGVLRLAHAHNCRVYLTLNIMLLDSDIPELISLLNKLANTTIDGVIVQDWGLLYLLSEHYRGLRVHASTQLTTHNAGQIELLAGLGVTRVNLSRELSLGEIRELTRVGHGRSVAAEVFVHGSYCLSFSGLCYLSSVRHARSGNRGRCSQPCRDRYLCTPVGAERPLNLKDNSAYFDVEALADAGVDALKIEGRVKQFSYVYTVTRAWREQLQSFYEQGTQLTDDSALYTVFNRDFTNGYLRGDIHEEMFSEHPRNHAAQHLHERIGRSAEASTGRFSDESYEEIAQSRARARQEIDQLSARRSPLRIRVSGEAGEALRVAVFAPQSSFEVESEVCLAPQSSREATPQLTREMFGAKLSAVNSTEYYIEHLDLDDLAEDLYVPFKELTLLRDKILFILRGSREAVAPVVVPVVAGRKDVRTTPTLSVLISGREDLHLCDDTRAEVHYQLPGCWEGVRGELAQVFGQNPGLVPWFPAVLIGDDYTAAVEFLRRVQPKRVVTNNTGIAAEAHEQGISWIAGPQLNVANSYSLLCLHQRYACGGAFVSNELSKEQMARITAPQGVGLFYSIYHPVVLLSSRQCLFHQVTGCDQDRITETCLSHCERAASITTPDGASQRIWKTKGNYASLYHETHFLNTDVATDLPNLFSGFLVDLTNVETETQVAVEKSQLVQLFEKHLQGEVGSAQQLRRCIQPTNHVQYERGI